MTDLQRELARKAFHMLSLLYLAVYAWLGRAGALWLLGAWAVVAAAGETARLKSKRLNALLFGALGPIARESEARKMSGIVWTSLGCWLAILFYGGRPPVVAAVILYLAFGDASAALVGKRYGRISLARWTGRPKSLEGSLACLSVCMVMGWVAGVGGTALVAGAAAATLLELFPLPPDDNLWMPVGAGFVLVLSGAG